MFLNNQEFTEKKKKKLKSIPRNKWQWRHDDPKPMGCSKAFLRGKFIAWHSYLNKQENQQIYNLTLHTKQPEKEQQNKVGRRKEIKIRGEINDN